MKIAILTGGISGEREVALRSAKNLKTWCETSKNTAEIYDFPESIDRFLSDYKNYDFVVPMFHGLYGEDGQITAFLQTLGCPYAYSSFSVHSFCMDKYRTNLLVEKLGIKIPRSLFVARQNAITELISPLVCYPVIVKPNQGGSSIGTSKVDNGEELIGAQRLITDDDVIVQECIEGREFTVGVYKTPSGYASLPIMEVCNPAGLHGFAEKYESDGSNEIFAELEENIERSLAEMSIHIAAVLGCRGVIRIDWRYDGKHFYFLEVNTIPGFTGVSFIPKMWKQAKKTEKEFVEMLLY